MCGRRPPTSTPATCPPFFHQLDVPSFFPPGDVPSFFPTSSTCPPFSPPGRRALLFSDQLDVPSFFLHPGYVPSFFTTRSTCPPLTCPPFHTTSSTSPPFPDHGYVPSFSIPFLRPARRALLFFSHGRRALLLRGGGLGPRRRALLFFSHGRRALLLERISTLRFVAPKGWHVSGVEKKGGHVEQGPPTAKKPGGVPNAATGWPMCSMMAQFCRYWHHLG